MAAAPRSRLRGLASHLLSSGARPEMRAVSTTPSSRRLSEEELAQFWDAGFVVIHDLFKPQELQPLVDVVNLWVAEVAAELAQGESVIK